MRQTRDETYEDALHRAVHQIGRSLPVRLREQTDKFGLQRLDIANWMMVIGEELGEVYVDLNKRQFDNAKAEIEQTIMCLVRLYAEVEREQNGTAVHEKRLNLYVQAD